jgi:hypothetical protein
MGFIVLVAVLCCSVKMLAVLKLSKWPQVLVASLLHCELVKTAAVHFVLAQAPKMSVSQNKTHKPLIVSTQTSQPDPSLSVLCASMQNK